MADPIKIRASLAGDVVEVKMLMSHPMENGLRMGTDGNLIKSPTITADYIETVTVRNNDRVVLTADWASAVSRNPYLALRYKGGKAGDVVKVEWKDTTGKTGTGEAVIR